VALSAPHQPRDGDVILKFQQLLSHYRLGAATALVAKGLRGGSRGAMRLWEALVALEFPWCWTSEGSLAALHTCLSSIRVTGVCSSGCWTRGDRSQGGQLWGCSGRWSARGLLHPYSSAQCPGLCETVHKVSSKNEFNVLSDLTTSFYMKTLMLSKRHVCLSE